MFLIPKQFSLLPDRKYVKFHYLKLNMDKILFTIALEIAKKIHYVNTNQKRLKMTN